MNVTTRSVSDARPSAARVLFALAAVIIALGMALPTERYLTPERGLGYALGIGGGSMMLLLLVYPLRKRLPTWQLLGPVKRWFQLHMLLGVVGPICVLFHANFHQGATNSNVALWSMIIVATSGLVGRYFYGQIHFGMHGRRATLADLTAQAERLRASASTIAFFPALIAGLDAAERHILAPGDPAWFWRPVALHWRTARVRRRLRHDLRVALRTASRSSPTLAAHEGRLRRAASAYIDRRLIAARRLGELESFERLFSWWHVLHLPLFFLLLIAGVVHVVAVHVY